MYSKYSLDNNFITIFDWFFIIGFHLHVKKISYYNSIHRFESFIYCYNITSFTKSITKSIKWKQNENKKQMEFILNGIWFVFHWRAFIIDGVGYGGSAPSPQKTIHSSEANPSLTFLSSLVYLSLPQRRQHAL